MGVEIISIIKDFLNCKVKINNIHIIYEDNLDFLQSEESLQKFSMGIELKELEFKLEDI